MGGREEYYMCSAFNVKGKKGRSGERSNQVWHLGSDYGAFVLLYDLVYVLNVSVSHDVIG